MRPYHVTHLFLPLYNTRERNRVSIIIDFAQSGHLGASGRRRLARSARARQGQSLRRPGPRSARCTPYILEEKTMRVTSICTKIHRGSEVGGCLKGVLLLAIHCRLPS